MMKKRNDIYKFLKFLLISRNEKLSLFHLRIFFLFNLVFINVIGFFRNSFVFIYGMVVLCAFYNYCCRVINFGYSSSSTPKSSTQSTLPINYGSRCIVSFEYKTVDQKSFVTHAGIEIHSQTTSTWKDEKVSLEYFLI